MWTIISLIGILYFLGAYLMWQVADVEKEDDLNLRPWWSAFWPIIVVCSIIEKHFWRE